MSATIIFQVLGSLGFLVLIFFLGYVLGWHLAWRRAIRMIRDSDKKGE